MTNVFQNDKLSKVKEKVKKFFKKISTEKDSINLNKKVDPDAKYLHRDDLKMY